MKRYAWILIGPLALAACSSSNPSASPSPPASSPAAVASVPSLPPPSISYAMPPVTPTKTYTSNTKGFQLTYPAKWQPQNKGGACKATVCFPAPEQSGQVPALIAVNVRSWTTPTNLQTAWNTQRQLAIGSLGTKPKTVQGTQGNTTLGGQPAKTATYTFTWGLIPATARQTMVLSADGTSATFLTVVSATDIWKQLDPTFKQVEASFVPPS